MSSSNAAGLMLSDDLLFTSRVVGAAESLGLVLKTAKTAAALERGTENLACVLVDVHLPGLDLPSVVRAIRDKHPRCRIVGYGSHVAADVLKAAREAGCDLVLPRSKFVEDLNRDLSIWFGL
jgi:CheY-like chemotaxis protein